MIYTRTGDAGTTSLVGGARVAKDDPRVEAYGTVDELMSNIGLLIEWVRPWGEEHSTDLRQAQQQLFTIQTLLATEDEALAARLPQLPEAEVQHLESLIDALQAKVPQLHNFVIPGGTVAAAQAHVCRTVCRRAERRVVSLSHQASLPPALQRYLNRLSDYLFVLGRYATVREGLEEETYKP